MNDFRVNPERSCKLAARRFAQELDARFPRSSLSLSLSLRLRSRELPFRTFYFLNNAATERETERRGGGEGKTSGRGPVGHSRANHAGHTLRVGRYVAAAGTGSSINLDHGVISPPLLGIRTTRRTPARGPPSTVNARIIYGERDASMLLIYAILIRRDYRILESLTYISTICDFFR